MAIAHIARTFATGAAALFLLTAVAAGQANGPDTTVAQPSGRSSAGGSAGGSMVRFPEGRNSADIRTGQDPATDAKNKAGFLDRSGATHPTSPTAATVHGMLRKLW